jgi:formate-dependent phosphoribosylglycinamide formyltransferase (GAR transformylase)
VVGATTVRAWGTAAMAATMLEDEVRDLRRRIMYNEPTLFDLTITFLVVRSFTDKSNISNSIEHQLSVVKQ